MDRAKTHYYPLTATPFLQSDSYCELAPCRALRPYIRCFWGTVRPADRAAPPEQPGVVIPDTCMDIIFQQDCATGRVYGCFCGLDERPYTVQAAAPGSRLTFAIRFYAWAAIRFAEDSLADSKNRTSALEAHFPRLCRALGPRLFAEGTGLAERARMAEAFLLETLHPFGESAVLDDAVQAVLCTGGAVRMRELARAALASPRQLERVFHTSLGCSPKTFASLVRCQCVWQDMVREPDFCVQDAVARYGYCDQAHLLHDFKRYHQCSPLQALARAQAQKSRFFTIRTDGPVL